MKDLNGKKLANGTQVTVTAIDLDKQILTVADAQQTYQLSANNGLFVYGYAFTSYASQQGNFLKKVSLNPKKLLLIAQ